MTNRATSTNSPLLELRGITKRFPGVLALDGVDFILQAGEIHALLGENGAGKSTLIKVLTGVYRRDTGSMQLGGLEIDPQNPAQAEQLGISTVYQEVNLIPELSVAENISIGRQPRRYGLIDWQACRLRAQEALAPLELSIDVTQPLRTYSIAVQQMVAIARALDQQAKVLVLDEPTSSLDTAEVEQLFRVMRQLRKDGMGIVFVSHFLDQVYAISDRLTVLRGGNLVGEYGAESLPRLELISKMIGKEVAQVADMENRHAATQAAGPHPVVLQAQGLNRRGAVEDMDLKIHSGEVVGLAGLLGSGRTETARLLFGIDQPDSGTIEVDGKFVRKHGPRTAIRNRIALAPEDRKEAGIIPNLSVRENIVLALQGRRGWLRRIKRAEQQLLADRFIRALNIATPNSEKPAGQLSGGNQQKVILARWLAMQPKILILDEPTRGIDVGAKAEIENLVTELCADGMALLFISSELAEVCRDSHRIVVLRDRRKIGELTGEEIQLERIMQIIADEQPTEEAEDRTDA